MTHVALIRMTWPEKALWQNRPSHWAKKAKAVKGYRTEAWAKALEQSVRQIKSDPVLRFSFHPPDRRRRDLQNMPATQKAAIDGIADALGMDDQHFRIEWPTEWAEPVEGGCVIIEVSQC